MMLGRLSLCVFATLYCLQTGAHGDRAGQVAHSHSQADATAHYLGNEGLLIEHGNTKLLFDPFFHRDFGIYQTVPAPLKRKLLEGQAPFDSIDAIIISHAHEDHFNAAELMAYLMSFSTVYVFAPAQAIDAMGNVSERQAFESLIATGRVHPVHLDYGEPPWKARVGDVYVDAVRIPHAGWPGRQDVQNMVFRVTTREGATVMHMGDADPDVDHYLPHRNHWNTLRSDMAFPPYWFYLRLEGRDILDSYLNVEKHVGVHVPVIKPNQLSKGHYDVFHTPGETRVFALSGYVSDSLPVSQDATAASSDMER